MLLRRHVRTIQRKRAFKKYFFVLLKKIREEQLVEVDPQLDGFFQNFIDECKRLKIKIRLLHVLDS